MARNPNRSKIAVFSGFLAFPLFADGASACTHHASQTFGRQPYEPDEHLTHDVL
jgi:hypothetical protein